MDDPVGNELASDDSDEDIDFTARKKHGKQALRINETDSEDEVSPPPADPVETNDFDNNSDQNSNESKESSDEEDNVSTTLRKKKRRKKKNKFDEGETDDEDQHKSKISALCDRESSSSDESDRQVHETVPTKKIERAPQRMSAKQAEEQMKLIQSESQRLARDCHMSVPYHKPKPHSLKDFLNRRTINRPVPMAMTKKAAATIKMSKEELEQYAKSLADRNKESQEFYRSESDDSNNETETKCDEQLVTPPDGAETLVDSPVAAETVEKPMEIASNDADATEIAETKNDVEISQPIVDDSVELSSEAADVGNMVAEVEEQTPADKSSEIVITSAANEAESQETIANARESIEIDYNFGEDDRSEAKTLKDLLPFYSNMKPCLKGPVNGVINLDLDDVKVTKTGGEELMERFMKHVVLKPNRSAKEMSILSADNGVIEVNNVKIDSDDQNCIHSKPRKDVFKLKQELSLRIAARRKEELQKKQMPTITIPLEDSDSDCEIQCDKEKEVESACDVNSGNTKENKETDVDEEIDGEVVDGDEEDTEDIETNEGHDSNAESDENDKSDFDDDEAVDDDEEIDSASDGGEKIPKTKQRKRIILMDNSDDEDDVRSGDVHLEDSVKSADLNTTSIDISLDLGLDDNQFPATDPIDKTMSQISKNQSRADQMIDSCSKIVPEPIETDNHLSTLFTQNADGMSVTELLDLCSGSFVTQATNANFVDPDPDPSFQTQTDNYSENEFSDDEIGVPKKKSKQRKKVNISDDEDGDNEDANIPQDDESNASEKDENNESDVADDHLSEDEAVDKIVEYDSEENEIEVPVVQRKKISDFFENEAELSESEWGSADEDERNLDKFDIELGDEDEFDQNQLVSELDRIHRRRMLDQDAREVKIIKDTHFEDEEESGLGRQRQYRWKHMENSLTLDENHKDVEGNENAKSDDETEETWRRMRYERNNILQETKAQNDTIMDSKLILTTRTKKRISIVKTTANLNTSATKDLSFLISRMKEEQTHRSSLLIRDEQTLANLAKMTTEDGGIPSVNSNSKNFLFNVISTDADKPLGKRKLDDEATDGDSKNRKITKKMKKSTLSVLDKLM